MFELQILFSQKHGGAAEDDGINHVERRVARFKDAIAKNWRVINNQNFFEEEIGGHSYDIDQTENFYLAIDFFEAFAFEELDNAEKGEKGGREEEKVTGVFSDFIDGFVGADGVFKG